MTALGADTSISIIGGTGALGSGLARRIAAAGLPVVIGSRDAARAEAAAAALRARQADARVRGLDNRAASEAGEVVILAVPFASQAATLGEIAPHLAGKLLVDTTVPLVPPKVARVQLPAGGSAALIARGLVGDDVRLVAAFHNIAADLLDSEAPLDCDVLVCGDEVAARDTVVALAARMGLRAWHAGPLANAAAAEALTSVLIFMNRRYGGHAGLRITGLDG